MATLRQYCDTDFSHLLRTTPNVVNFNDGETCVEVQVSLHYDFDANAKFISCYIPKSEKTHSVCVALANSLDELLAVGNHMEVQGGFVGENLMSCNTMRFCGRIYFYIEEVILGPEYDRLRIDSESKGLLLQFRGLQFAESRSRLEVPLAFISHDWRDKELIARPMAIELSKLMCPVWYDEFTLKLGDPLRESIEKGLKECKKCVLVLSPNFLSNRGWTKTEFNAIFTREILETSNLILPIWCGIDKKELYEYSPTLVDRVGINWDKGLEEVARQIRRAID